jgi:hypothetical protein
VRPISTLSAVDTHRARWTDAVEEVAEAHRALTAVIHHARRRPVGRQLSGAHSLAHAPRLPRPPEAGVARGISTIVAVYRTDPVMVVGETAEGALLELSLHELADGHERLARRLWQALVERYRVFQIG